MRRVVITGAGAVSPCGKDLESSWAAIVAGRSGIAPITAFDASEYTSRIAGEATDFEPLEFFEKKRLREGDRFIHLAMGAGVMAVRDSGYEPTDAQRERTGTIVGAGFGGITLVEQMSITLHEKGPRRVSPYFIPGAISNLAPGQLSMRFGFRGTCYTTTSACASGAHAIGEATRAIQRGELDACLAGGVEAAITGVCVAGFCQMRALSTRNDEPEKASRPWDRDRDGFVIGEGAGAVFLEEFEAAKKRGARILAEVVGYGSTADAYHLTQPAPEGEGAQRAMRAALEDARIGPEQIEYLNAHATSTGPGDVNELLGIRKVFGAHATSGLLLSSTKSMVGHLLGGAGAFETVVCVQALRHGLLPPTINVDNPIEEAAGMDLIPGSARERSVRYVMNNSFGFGGTNAALVLRAPD